MRNERIIGPDLATHASACAFLLALFVSRTFAESPLYRDDFSHGLDQWSIELEKPGLVEAKGGALVIDVPAGATLWFKHELSGPVKIQYEATMIQAGGPHDRVSDLNCFWMATDARSPEDLFATRRSGAFADYNQLLAYYVGQGGNGNTTTRFRRYIGSAVERLLLPEHDLKDPQFLIKPNTPQIVQLIASGRHIQYWRDGRRIFDFVDAMPYTHGYFALRTTFSHLEIRHLQIDRP
jgi:hypothetical protein